MNYLYTAWFRDELALPEDEDFEWPACFVVEAEGADAAQRWGDHLSSSFSLRRGTEKFLWSDVEPSPQGLQGLPAVRDGVEATDAEIGW
jgi:hypothetical protein